MPRGRPLAPLEIGIQERETLERLVARRKTGQALAQRARLILGCAEGKSNKTVSAQEGLSPQTVGKWRRRFLERGLDGLLDEPRPGPPRKITNADVEKVVTLTLETTPDDATHWSTRFDGQPHRHEPERYQPYLESVLSSAPSLRDLQAVYRPSLHREGPRHRGAVPQPAGQGSRTVRRRKIGYPSTGPHRTFVAHASGTSRETYSRLRSARNHRPVRRP